MRIGLREFYSFLHGEERLREKKKYVLETLNNKNIGEFSFIEEEKRYDIVANIILTGGTERGFISKINEMEEPILILFDSKDNSLAATLEIKTKLEDIGKKSIILSIDEDATKMRDIFKAVLIKKELKGSKLGSIGIPSSWLIASIPDRDSVRNRFGMEIIDVELQELYREIEKIEDDEVLSIKEEFVKKAEKVVEPTPDHIKGAIKIYLALKRIIKKYGLSSITLSCFTILDVLKNTGCFALSKLNDEGIIAGCEGDVESAITMFILYKLTGNIPFMANPSDIDLKENTLTMAHCTIATKLLKNYTIRSHFESGIGVGIQGDLNPKDFTLFRLGGKNMDKFVLFTGEGVPHNHSEHLCRTQIKLKIHEDLSTLLERPAGNHLILIEGDHREIIKNFLKII